MGKKNNKNWGSNKRKSSASDNFKKILSGVCFMAACFLSVYVLVAHNDLVWLVAVMFLLLMAAAYFFLGQIFNNTEEQIDDLLKAQEALEAVKEEDRKAADAAFKRQVEEQMKSMDRTTRAMFMTMKKSAEAQAVQLANMETRIDKAIDEQNAGIKTIIKYNKENARQVAMSSKDAMEKMASSLTDELKAQSRNQVQPAVQYVQMPAMQPMQQPVYQQPVVPQPTFEQPAAPEPAVEEFTEEAADIPVYEEPVAEEAVYEDPVADEVTEEFTTEELAEEPASEGLLSEDEIAAMLAGAMDTEESAAEEAVYEEPVTEEVTEEFTTEEPAEEPASEGLLSEDEIAAMLAGAMDTEESAAEEAVYEEPVTEEVAEEFTTEEPAEEPAVASEADLAAATGVDLSDPNASLSADDIAKLFAAANNASEPVPEPEEVVTEPAEEPAVASEADLAAATGVDLSDPNASLSADDIAKLFAAAGN